MFRTYKKIHMVGIGGIGMSGIAQVLMTLGYEVSGSDLKESDMISRLKRLGANVHVGHHADNVSDADLVIISSAVQKENPEMLRAKELGIPVIPRAEMLSELMRLKYGIAIAGTHGKTSTTAIIAWVLEEALLDPTAIIGGKVISFKSNAKLGSGEFMVAEADESDRSFLKLVPTIGVITNIDPEHMENYADFDDMKRSYVEFANKVPFYGSAVCCNDHPVVREIIPQITRKVITYGKADADYCYKDIVQSEENIFFTAMKGDKELGKVKLPMVGVHNAANATAAIAVADELGVDFCDTLKALRSFKGIARRFQILSRRGPIVVDDYAHHPVEIGVTMNAARECWPDHRLTAIFQPHRFTRFAANFDGFIEALRPADRLLVTEVYAAGEAEIEGVNSLKFVDKFKKIFPSKEVKYIVEEGDVVKECLSCNQSQEVMLFLGAGSVTKMAAKVAKSI